MQLRDSFKAVELKVSIPQAVGAVATVNKKMIVAGMECFNTASGRCCCNGDEHKTIKLANAFQYRKR